ncbi:unnamed protein product [Brugia pahangi]|uniref:Uncharacterized protein n=1 Tax=Brugia pahangi TaxID=6280 RepID=A0A0N4T0X4_BRUPA|nr:unnamed protein product [Brugia pahangi]
MLRGFSSRVYSFHAHQICDTISFQLNDIDERGGGSTEQCSSPVAQLHTGRREGGWRAAEGNTNGVGDGTGWHSMAWCGVVWRGVATQQHRNGIVRLRVLLYEETTEDRCECVHGAAEDGWVVASAGLGWVVRATEKSEMECGLGSVGTSIFMQYCEP